MTLRPLFVQARHLLKTLAYSEALPRAWRHRRLQMFWERQAPLIHAKWGNSREDVGVVSRILETYRPASVLDIGCGTGRLFGVYRQQGVENITGVDISAAALERARQAYPDVPTTQVPLQRATFPHRFDLIVSNRVLQHIPRGDIREVIAKLCASGSFVYLNELSASDEVPEDCLMVRHDYERLFAVHGWRTLERGRIGKQTYLLFHAAPSALTDVRSANAALLANASVSLLTLLM